MQMVQRLDVSGSEAIESIADEGLRYSPACEETYKSRPVAIILLASSTPIKWGIMRKICYKKI